MTTPKKLSRHAVDEFEGAWWNAINELLASSEMHDLSRAQRVAYLAYWYMSEVENGGHFQYFTNRPHFDHDEVAHALEAIGSDEHSLNLRSAHSVIHTLKLAAPQTTEEYLVREDAANLTVYDVAYANCKRPVFELILEYARTHEEEFIDWAP